ncbi:MAG: HAMP domain-containing sensor histidine kinase [Bacteroidales bacterium]|nr:HAMP domain-containing sensor histidine kinase [Bacteroidales bacterium]
MKQKYYHLFMLLLSLMLMASGCLLVAGCLCGWPWSVMLLCACVTIGLLCAIWSAASFLPNQVKTFLGSMLNHDTMSRFPETHDEELKQMYADMNRILHSYGQSQMELETKRLYYDRILRIMTHELRNSITPIISLSEDMMQRPYSAEDTQEAISVINEQCTSIKGFLDSYHTLTHLPKPVMQEVDARSMLLSLEKLYTGQNISIQCTQGLKLVCDEGQIMQVLKNLVKNAIEAPATQIQIIASCPDGRPRICVSDNGPGIPAGKQEEIFLPFYTSKSSGSGIGLALSRQIMSLHKGSLSCSGNETGGASFILQF